MQNKKLVIVGGGETALLATEYFQHDSDYDVVSFAVHDKYIQTSSIAGLPVVPLENLPESHPPDAFEVFIALASGRLNHDRAGLFIQLKNSGYTCASYISSRAFSWRNTQIGENCFILEHNTLQPFTRIEDNVTLWSGNHIGHRTIVKSHCFLTSHCVISGFCEIGEYSFIGVNSAVADNVKIAPYNFIAMGTAITKDTEENKVYRGNPATALKISAKKYQKVR